MGTHNTSLPRYKLDYIHTYITNKYRYVLLPRIPSRTVLGCVGTVTSFLCHPLLPFVMAKSHAVVSRQVSTPSSVLLGIVRSFVHVICTFLSLAISMVFAGVKSSTSLVLDSAENKTAGEKRSFDEGTLKTKTLVSLNDNTDSSRVSPKTPVLSQSFGRDDALASAGDSVESDAVGPDIGVVHDDITEGVARTTNGDDDGDAVDQIAQDSDGLPAKGIEQVPEADLGDGDETDQPSGSSRIVPRSQSQEFVVVQFRELKKSKDIGGSSGHTDASDVKEVVCSPDRSKRDISKRDRSSNCSSQAVRAKLPTTSKGIPVVDVSAAHREKLGGHKQHRGQRQHGSQKQKGAAYNSNRNVLLENAPAANPKFTGSCGPVSGAHAVAGSAAARGTAFQSSKINAYNEPHSASSKKRLVTVDKDPGNVDCSFPRTATEESRHGHAPVDPRHPVNKTTTNHHNKVNVLVRRSGNRSSDLDSWIGSQSRQHRGAENDSKKMFTGRTSSTVSTESIPASTLHTRQDSENRKLEGAWLVAHMAAAELGIDTDDGTKPQSAWQSPPPSADKITSDGVSQSMNKSSEDHSNYGMDLYSSLSSVSWANSGCLSSFGSSLQRSVSMGDSPSTTVFDTIKGIWGESPEEQEADTA
jgi:hypothetical protein